MVCVFGVGWKMGLYREEIKVWGREGVGRVVGCGRCVVR